MMKVVMMGGEEVMLKVVMMVDVIMICSLF